jgi:hypothetical protein
MANLIPNFYRGDTVPIQVNYKKLTNITGWIFTITFKAALTDATPALQLQQTAILIHHVFMILLMKSQMVAVIQKAS